MTDRLQIAAQLLMGVFTNNPYTSARKEALTAALEWADELIVMNIEREMEAAELCASCGRVRGAHGPGLECHFEPYTREP